MEEMTVSRINEQIITYENHKRKSEEDLFNMNSELFQYQQKLDKLSFQIEYDFVFGEDYVNFKNEQQRKLELQNRINQSNEINLIKKQIIATKQEIFGFEQEIDQKKAEISFFKRAIQIKLMLEKPENLC